MEPLFHVLRGGGDMSTSTIDTETLENSVQTGGAEALPFGGRYAIMGLFSKEEGEG